MGHAAPVRTHLLDAALFVLVADLVERLYYLKTALAASLAFVAVKMALADFVGKIGPEISS